MSKDTQYRLKLFWGAVDKKHIKSFLPFIKPGKILDMGCGMGSTSNFLSTQNLGEITGLDFSQEELDKAKKWYPHINYIQANAEEMPFADETFDTIILRDALHHFYEEADFDKVGKEIVRILKKDGVLIFFDPNVNFIIKTLRKVAKHEDAECSYEEARDIVKKFGFKTIHTSFNTVFSLPLSGGYVFKNFVPHIPILYKVLLGFERILEVFINIFGLGRFLCWRYLIVSKKPSV